RRTGGDQAYHRADRQVDVAQQDNHRHADGQYARFGHGAQQIHDVGDAQEHVAPVAHAPQRTDDEQHHQRDIALRLQQERLELTCPRLLAASSSLSVAAYSSVSCVAAERSGAPVTRPAQRVMLWSDMPMLSGMCENMTVMPMPGAARSAII